MEAKRCLSTITTVCLFIISHRLAPAQSFSSGSTGADGPLNLTTPGIITDLKTVNPTFDPEGDNVFNFTTINIGPGVTVKLSGKVLNGPVYWLATGPVQIDGTINLDGEDGQVVTSLATRLPNTPGSGGYSGGLGGFGSGSAQLSQPGNGPGGTNTCNSAQNTSNEFIVPLIGGSGGGGERSTGGAGGGALLIVSSSSISVTGLITAKGGVGIAAAGGAGGSIRLVAPTISGNGSIITSGGAGGPIGPGCISGNGSPGAPGRVRLEAFTFTTTLPGRRATPFNIFLPTNTTPPSLNVVSVAGVPVPASPTVSFTVPDVTFSSSVAVPISIQARNIPPGTVVKLFISSENGPDLTVNSSALQGTLQQSTATASATLPPGFSTAYVKANWTQ